MLPAQSNLVERSNASMKIQDYYLNMARLHCCRRPSRNSFMSGRRPTNISDYDFEVNFRDASGGADIVSMPQYFKNNGYLTLGLGKTFQ